MPRCVRPTIRIRVQSLKCHPSVLRNWRNCATSHVQDPVLRELLRLASNRVVPVRNDVTNIQQHVAGVLDRVLAPGSAEKGHLDAARTAGWLTTLVRARHFQIAIAALHHLESHRLDTNEYHYSIIVNACAKAKEPPWELACSLLERMQLRGLRNGPTAHNAAISTCGKAGEWQVACAILGGMRADQIAADQISYNSAISACARQNRWKSALVLFEEARAVGRSAVTYCAAISACGRGKQWQAAVSLFEDMSLRDVRRDTVVVNATISACAGVGQHVAALKIFLDIFDVGSDDVRPTAFTYGALITACEKGFQWQTALWLVARMDATGIARNSITCNAAISACEKGSEWKTSLHLLHEMMQGAPQADTITYSAVISSCAKWGLWMIASQLLADMSHTRVKQDTITHNAFVCALEKGHQWAAALSFLTGMRYDKVAPTTITHNSVISACANTKQWQEALCIFETILPADLSQGSFNAILDAVHDRPTHGHRIFDQGRRAGAFPAIHKLCSSGGNSMPLSRNASASIRSHVDLMQFQLDLHDLSPGAALMAVEWWLRCVIPELLAATPKLPAYVEIITGWGRSRRTWDTTNVKATVEAFLRSLGLPLHMHSVNPGRICVDTMALTSAASPGANKVPEGSEPRGSRPPPPVAKRMLKRARPCPDCE